MPDLTSCRRLVFAELPPSLERFERVVRAAPRVERLYFAYGDASLDPVFFHVPDRERFKFCMRFFCGKNVVYPRRDLEGLHRRTGMSKRMIAFILRVFSELGFLEGDGEPVERGGKSRQALAGGIQDLPRSTGEGAGMEPVGLFLVPGLVRLSFRRHIP